MERKLVALLLLSLALINLGMAYNIKLKKLWSVLAADNRIEAIAFNENGLMGAVSFDYCIYFVDQGGNVLSHYCGDDYMNDVSYANHKFLAINYDNYLYVFDENGNFIKKVNVGEHFDDGVTAFSKGFIVCDEDCAYYDWSFNQIWTVHVGDNVRTSGPAVAKGYVYAMAVKDMKIKIFKLDTGSYVGAIKLDDKPLDVEACGNYLAVATSRSVYLYVLDNPTNPRLLWRAKDFWMGDTPDSRHLAFSPDCKYIAVADTSHDKVVVLEYRNGNRVVEYITLSPYTVGWWRDRIVVGGKGRLTEPQFIVEKPKTATVTPIATARAAKNLVLVINNPNSEDLTDFQLRVKLPSSLAKVPITITTPSGSNVPFCYETKIGQCTTDYTKGDGYIWIKIPSIDAGGSLSLYVSAGSNGATAGYKVFLLYDDFSTKNTTIWKWTTSITYGFSYDSHIGDMGVWYSGDANGNVATMSVKKFKVPFIVEGLIWKNDYCSDHFIYVSPKSDVPWEWGYGPGTVSFAWDCDNIVVYGPSSASKEVPRPKETYYLVRAIVTPNNSTLVTQVLNNPSDVVSVGVNQGLSGSLHVYFGADQDTIGMKSFWYWLRVRKYAPEPLTYTWEEAPMITKASTPSTTPTKVSITAQTISCVTEKPVKLPPLFKKILSPYLKLKELYDLLSNTSGNQIGPNTLKKYFQRNMIYIISLAQFHDLLNRIARLDVEAKELTKRTEEILSSRNDFNAIYTAMNYLQKAKIDLALINNSLSQMDSLIIQLINTKPEKYMDCNTAWKMIYSIINAKSITELYKYISKLNGDLDKPVKTIIRCTIDQTVSNYQSFKKELVKDLTSLDVKIRRLDQMLKLVMSVAGG